MSMTEDEARYDQWMADLYAEHSAEAIKEFTVECLQSYYLKDPLLASAPYRSLSESRALLANHPSAALVFAATAVEVGLKVVLLKPVVYGLVHDVSAAGLITDLTVRNGGDKYRDLLVHILSKFGGVDLRNFSRANSKKGLWEEIQIVQERRNTVLHRADVASTEEAEQSIAVASVVLEELFPAVVTSLGLHVHDGVRVCNDWRCKYPMTNGSLLANEDMHPAAEKPGGG
ncbi:MAG: hypothetical protein FJW34_04165 [Acidobacteria bacterium]|nr:hypothetical protein [Acidobacteriota bacterium]MBM4042974.1 hypothetical protein [Planctomycetota bacterium]